MPVFDADATLPHSRPVRRAVGSGRRGGTARGVGVAVTALVLLTGGVVVGGMLENPGPSPSSSPPAASTAATACATLPADLVPAFGLGVIGDERTYGGEFGYFFLRGQSSGDKGWVVPGVGGRGSVASGTALEVRAQSGACIRRVVAEIADASLRDPASEAQALVDATINTPTTNLALGTLPDGEWVVRVTAYFETGVHGSGGQVIRQSYFRMRVGPGPFPTLRPRPTPEPTPRPAATPEVACGPEPTSPGEVEILVSTPAAPEAVAGAHGDSNLPVVAVAIGDQIELRTSGDVCAISWSIRALEPTTGDVLKSVVRDNPTGDPALSIQDRWRMQVPIGDSRLIADLQLASGASVVRQWTIHGLAFSVPAAILTGSNGRRAGALPGCGLTVVVPNVYSAWDNCGSLAIPDDLDVLRVPAWSMVVLEIPDWLIRTWDGSCGRVETSEGQEYFAPTDGCYLGSANENAGLPVVRFLARPGERMLQLNVTAIATASSFSVPLYVIVVGE
jgi:hypothetical protein